MRRRTSPSNAANVFPTRPHFSPNGQWLAVPLYHIFGSEELSVLAPAIAESRPHGYVALNPGTRSNCN